MQIDKKDNYKSHQINSFCKISILILIISLFSCNRPDSIQKTEIMWDKWGVPHIYAKSETDMYYAFGWSQMHNHANLLMKLYATARGKASEYYGSEYIISDQLIRLFQIPETSATQFESFTDEEKEILDAFVDGINAYAEKHPETISENAKKVLPITPADILAHGKRVINYEFIANRDILLTLNELKEDEPNITPGSNSYAIAPSKSISGNAMLVANPHLPWSDFFLFFEAHLNATDFNLYGVTLVGMPILNIAFNEYLGWTHTVNTIDASDRYELTLQNGGYLFDGETKPIIEKKTIIKVLQEDGNMQENEVTLKYSEHGPIIGEKNGKAYAVRIAGMENDSYYYQYHKMGKSKNYNEFDEAVQMMQIPMFNLIYADKDGNIMYLFNGNIPVRGEGDWSFWRNKIDGTRSSLIWNRYHNYKELPKILNPETGFVQNANDAPWTSTYPIILKPEDYPPYFSPAPNQSPTSFRAQRAINMIRDDNSISFDELVNYKLNTEMETAYRFLDDLLDAVDKYPNELAKEAAEILKNWDKSTDRESKGSILFAKWYDKIKRDMFAIPWSPDNPVTTPDGLKNQKEAITLLTEAANEVINSYGSLDIAWGDVYRFRVGENEVPANGGHENYGIFRTMYFQKNDKLSDKKEFAYHGDTYVAVIEFSDTVRANLLLSYGNATEPSGEFMGNQLSLLSENSLRQALLNKKDVLDNISFIEELK